jgi:hypothetical protein
MVKNGAVESIDGSSVVDEVLDHQADEFILFTYKNFIEAEILSLRQCI